MQVTELKKLSEGKYVLYTDYEPYSVVYTSDIRRLKLIVGEEVDMASSMISPGTPFAISS